VILRYVRSMVECKSPSPPPPPQGRSNILGGRPANPAYIYCLFNQDLSEQSLPPSSVAVVGASTECHAPPALITTLYDIQSVVQSLTVFCSVMRSARPWIATAPYRPTWGPPTPTAAACQSTLSGRKSAHLGSSTASRSIFDLNFGVESCYLAFRF